MVGGAGPAALNIHKLLISWVRQPSLSVSCLTGACVWKVKGWRKRRRRKRRKWKETDWQVTASYSADLTISQVWQPPRLHLDKCVPFGISSSVNTLPTVADLTLFLLLLQQRMKTSWDMLSWPPELTKKNQKEKQRGQESLRPVLLLGAGVRASPLIQKLDRADLDVQTFCIYLWPFFLSLSIFFSPQPV